MRIGEAKTIARAWVNAELAGKPGFRGAFFHGSVNWLEDEAELPPTSDLDVMAVFENAPPAGVRLGKFVQQGVLLEISPLPADQVQTPEQVLANYRLAGSFRNASVFADPTGELTALQTVVARDYAQRRWVEARVADAEANCLGHLASWRPDAPLEAQATAWLFGTGVTTHLLLAAGLRNPTVRTRYLAVRRLLAEHGRLDVYASLLALLGVEEMTRATAERHLAAMTAAFDAASIIHAPVAYAADLTALARPVAVDGSRALIDAGDHREAIFWMVATFARCQAALHHSHAGFDRFDDEFRALLADLGLAAPADFPRRIDAVRAALPALRRVAAEIMAATPEIVDESRSR